MTEQAELVRILRRLVHTDRLLSLEAAWRYCDIVGIPRKLIEQTDFPEIRQ